MGSIRIHFRHQFACLDSAYLTNKLKSVELSIIERNG
jgi:hypothetical protein